jgi:hypothetical protein
MGEYCACTKGPPFEFDEFQLSGKATGDAVSRDRLEVKRRNLVIRLPFSYMIEES